MKRVITGELRRLFDAARMRLSLPVLFGYIPLGAAFGVMFSELGYHWLYATLMGVVIYAGAGQFLAVGLLASGLASTSVGAWHRCAMRGPSSSARASRRTTCAGSTRPPARTRPRRAPAGSSITGPRR